MTFENYRSFGFKPIRLKGYNPRWNGQRNYKMAKEPIDAGFTKKEYKSPSNEDLKKWMRDGGWVGWLVPEGWIALDVEDLECIRIVNQVLDGNKPPVNVTRNGLHLFFRVDHQYPGDDQIFLSSGIPVTYRSGGKNYVILPPVDGRKWEHDERLQDPPMLPALLRPYDRTDRGDVLRCLSFATGQAYRQKILAGYEDVDAAFVAYLLAQGVTDDDLHAAMRLVFLDQYDHHKTTDMIHRAQDRAQAGVPIIGPGSFIKACQDAKLQDILRFTRELETLAGTRLTSITTAGSNKRKGFILTSLGDLLGEPAEEVSWLVEDMLPSGGLSVCAGKPKSGKTTLSRNLALAVARGDKFLGRQVQQGRVLYLAFEEKRAEVKDHFQAMGADGTEPILVHIAQVPEDAMKELRRLSVEMKPVLIIVDTLFRLLTVRDSNEYAQVTKAMDPLLDIARETGAHVLVIHHATKGSGSSGGDSILGSTAIFGSVDTAVMIRRSERYRTIETIQRYGTDLPETTLSWNEATKTISLGDTKETEELNRVATSIEDFLKTQTQPLTEQEINEHVEGRKTYKSRGLRQLVSQEKVIRTGRGGKTDPFRYCGSHIYTGNQGTRTEKADIMIENHDDYSGSGDSQQETTTAEIPGTRKDAPGWAMRI